MIRLPPRSTRTVTLMPYTTLVRARPGRILVLGLTFKEGVPDLRNSRVVDIVDALAARGHAVDVHDPHADAGEAKRHCGVDLLASLDRVRGYDAVVGAVRHAESLHFGAADLGRDRKSVV